MNKIEYKTPISPELFLRDYLTFGIDNRVVAVESLLATWRQLDNKHRLIRGGKIHCEWGGAIEELFAITYALCALAQEIPNRDQSVTSAATAVFFHRLCQYRSRELAEFIDDHNFELELSVLMGLPEPGQLASNLNKSSDEVQLMLQGIGVTIEDMKRVLKSDGFREIFNKFKHPFLVVSRGLNPMSRPDELNVLLAPAEVGDVASGRPVLMDEQSVRNVLVNVRTIRRATEFLIQLALTRCDVD